MSAEVSVKRAMCFFCKPLYIQAVYVKEGRLVEVDAHISKPPYAETAGAFLEGMREGGDAPRKSGQCSAS